MNAILQYLYRSDSWWIWAVIMGLALYFPVRRLIWVLLVRRAAKLLQDKVQGATAPLDFDLPTGEIERLKKRASVTALLICYLVAILFTLSTFKGVAN